ncbi:SLATT domain-containing protein [Vibrio splendidus]|uniref:SLATT domain-containing protein n=1 Tax=Vibrio TaxID=662 RepID=UPI00111B6E90|nr:MULTISPECIES: SLATT domain-containing protein [Vibrio]MDH5939221.1 SLATT domain-containing protein [Vibrio splendidus]
MHINNEIELKLDLQKVEGLTDIWLKKLEDAQVGHYKETEHLNRVHQQLGITLIFITTGVTAFIFYKSPYNQELVQLILACASALAAALSGIVTFGRFGERAIEHRTTAGQYGKLRRQLELLQASSVNHENIKEYRSRLKTLRIEWEYVARNAPLTPKNRKISLFRSLFRWV